MQSQLEILRQTHEDIERLESASVHELLKKCKTHKDRYIQEKRTFDYISTISDKARDLIKLYQDEKQILKEELERIENDEFNEFYSRLGNIKEYFGSRPTEIASAFDPELLINEQLEQEQLDRMFSGEEGIARHLDLQTLFQEYINIKGINRISYLTYLNRFDRFKDIDLEIKKTKKYSGYSNSLFEYLGNWIRRSQPLFNVEKLETDGAVEFEEAWEKEQVVGWVRPPKPDSKLFCLACDKLFSKETVFEAHKTGKKHVKAIQVHGNVEGIDVAKKVDEMYEQDWLKFKPIAKVEFMIKKYTTHLADVREDTTSHVERKQTLTEEERLEDQEERPIDLQSDDEDEMKDFNPLKLPIGWDGKPIPYWLYKLHGLGVEYPCEICGGYVYMGRKAFERHFLEFRHAHGMRALGIPNGPQFKDITKIEDAYRLAEKLKKLTRTENMPQDLVEEFEDENGNVYNKRTFEDLKRQGII